MQEKYLYGIGFRDAYAGILAETKGKTKLKERAQFYKDHFGEHFSLDWHLEEEKE